MPMTRPWQPASPCRRWRPWSTDRSHLLSGDAYRHQAAYQDSAQPALLFVNALRGLRPTYERPRDWQDAQLDDAIAHLQNRSPGAGGYLQTYALFLDKQFEQVLALPSPGQEDATLAFSHQMLRIWAWQA